MTEVEKISSKISAMRIIQKHLEGILIELNENYPLNIDVTLNNMDGWALGVFLETHRQLERLKTLLQEQPAR